MLNKPFLDYSLILFAKGEVEVKSIAALLAMAHLGFGNNSDDETIAMINNRLKTKRGKQLSGNPINKIIRFLNSEEADGLFVYEDDRRAMIECLKEVR